MYETDENKNIGNLRMQNVTGKETLAAPMYGKNPTPFYPQLQIVNNLMPTSSNLSEPLGNDPNVVYPLGHVPPNFNASTHGNAPSTSSTLLNISINGNAPSTSNTFLKISIKKNARKTFNGNAPNSCGNAPLPPP